MSRTTDCGHPPSPHSEHTTGTATLPDGRVLCWTCADAYQREEMRTADTFVAYLAGDGKTITTWSGGILGTVRSRVERRVGFGRAKRHYLTVVDQDGKRWHGTSPGPNMYCKLRATKGGAS